MNTDKKKNKTDSYLLPFKDQHPMDIFSRLLQIEMIKNLGADVVKDLNENLVTSYEEEDGKLVYELDYEYMLFSAPPYQFEKTFEELEKKNPKKVSSLFGLDGKNLEYEV